MKQAFLVWTLALTIGCAEETPPAPVDNAPVDGPQLTFESTRHDFGKVERQVLKYSFKFKNTGNQTLEIKDVRAGCGCTVIQGYEKKIEPGKESTISAELNAATMKGRIEKPITVTSNDPKKPTQQLSLAAEVQVELMVLPGEHLGFGRLQRDSVTNLIFEINTTLPEPLEIKGVETGVPWLTAKVESSTTNSAKIQLATQPPLPWGVSRATVRVQTSLTRYSNITVNAMVQVPETISVSPTRLTFPKDKSREFNAMVRRNDGKEFHITELKTTDDFVSTTITTNTPGRLYTLRLSYAPKEGKSPTDGKIEILTDEPAWPKVELPYSFR